MKTRILKTLTYAWLLSVTTVAASHARDVTLQWDPNTEPTVAGYKVYYNADSPGPPFSGTGSVQGASPVTAGSATSATLTGLDPSRAYYFAVTAYDASGAESSYSNVASIAEAAPPTVSITSPSSNATVSGTTAVSISASDNVGVTRVELYVDGTLAGSDTASPYSVSFNASSLAVGSHTLLAKAYDAAGNLGQSASVSVSIVSDTSPPAVSISSPANGSSVAGTTTVSVSATDNMGVSKVELYLNGTLYASYGSAPYNISWDTTKYANSACTLTAKAYDAANNMGQSTAVTVTVDNPVADITAPTVSITSPASNAAVNGIATVTATASDNIGVARVEFYVNGALKATSTASPYNFSWDTAGLANGTYTLTAAAYDAAGNKTTSETRTVTVFVPQVQKGDVNGDGLVTLSDALMILKASVGSSSLTPAIQNYGDVAPLDASGKPAGDGTISISDALVVMRRAVGMITW